MDYVIPVLAGVFLKLNDDYIVDEPYITDPFVTATMKLFEAILITLTAYKNFWVTATFSLFNAFGAISLWKEYSNPHVFAYFFGFSFLLLLSIPYYTPLRLFDYPFIYGHLGFALVEPRLFPEEVSWTKFINRFVTAFVGIIGTYLYGDLLSTSVKQSAVLCTSYIIVSSLSQMLKLTVLPSTSSPQYA
jgi:hypothetical protein